MRILVVGAGGREHAIVRALAGTGLGAHELLCAPGNAGIAADARLIDIAADDIDGLVSAAVAEGVELVVVGPEVPLVAGLVDSLEAAGVPAFGPTAEAARLEGSKAHAKELMALAGVPTAEYRTFSDPAEALAYAPEASYPAVLKADGLAAGKGVVICADRAEAEAAVEALLVEHRFGEGELVWESFLEGEELSLLAICDGQNVVPLAPAQDYKRIFDGDEGPNTGGMGSYSPVPGIDRDRVEEILERVHRPIIALLGARGTPFRGVLYAGLMIAPDGEIGVLEFNCRFGDPETQAVLPRLRSDLAELCLLSREFDGLAHSRAEFGDDWAVTVVLASAGYPDSSSKGDVISGVEEADALEGVEVTHAGTARNDAGELVTAGGRVLNVTALGSSPAEARARAYEAAELISFEGRQVRRDIAERAEARV
ncbi:phosphoribosylamine--glycine ligase [Thermoleophilia bacterium SCSIO 60948]|nr:phosphoribosylamine--glycine ligase [Thermoleophilia bacterium SCSIO 60948]